MTVGANQPENARPSDEGEGYSGSDSTSTPRDSRPDGRLRVGVLLQGNDEKTCSYEMFEATEMNAEGAFLVGGLFLEVGELVTLELAAEGTDPVRAQARVLRLERGNRNGMAVAFQDLGDEERRALEDLSARVSGS